MRWPQKKKIGIFKDNNLMMKNKLLKWNLVNYNKFLTKKDKEE